MTLEDLATYEVIERAPICVEYRARDVCGMGPPSSGALTVGQMLGILSHFDLPGMGDGPEAAHLFAEAGKLAFADRGLYMADSDFVKMPTEGLLDPDYLASRAALIDPETAMQPASAGEPPWDDATLYSPDTPRPLHGTSHFVVKDRYGDMISITTTIETGFGSRVMTGGFLLNNELTVANRVEGGKRPRSSMAPTIVLEDGEPTLLIGSPGGSRIIPYVAGALVGILDFGLDPQVAIDRPHVVNRNSMTTEVEQNHDTADLVSALEAKGHEVSVADLNSGLHAIAITADGLVGAADKRREGAVAGE
jgi:gamma-glutamyltranspeptidase/glutathione hydrolase